MRALYISAGAVFFSLVVLVHHQREWISSSASLDAKAGHTGQDKFWDQWWRKRRIQGRDSEGDSELGGGSSAAVGVAPQGGEQAGRPRGRVLPVERIHHSNLSLAQFHDRFHATQTPVVIEGLTDTWPARRWNLETLADACAQERVDLQKRGLAVILALPAAMRAQLDADLRQAQPQPKPQPSHGLRQVENMTLAAVQAPANPHAEGALESPGLCES